MPQIAYDGDKPFRFAYGGRTYIVPPKQGGRWEIVYESCEDEFGFKKNRRVLKKTAETKRNFIDVPAGAIAHLFRGEVRKMHKNKIRIIDNMASQVEHEMMHLQAERSRLEEEKQELAEKLAAFEGSRSPKAKTVKSKG